MRGGTSLQVPWASQPASTTTMLVAAATLRRRRPGIVIGIRSLSGQLLELDRPSKTYRCGEALSGSVNLEAADVEGVKEFELGVVCEMKTKISRTEYYTDSKGKSRSRTKRHRNDDSVTLLERQFSISDVTPLDRGAVFHPFTVDLPLGMPPTFRNRHGGYDGSHSCHVEWVATLKLFGESWLAPFWRLFGLSTTSWFASKTVNVPFDVFRSVERRAQLLRHSEPQGAEVRAGGFCCAPLNWDLHFFRTVRPATQSRDAPCLAHNAHSCAHLYRRCSRARSQSQ